MAAKRKPKPEGVERAKLLGLPASIGSIFDCMAIAEEEIASANANGVQGIFAMLLPPNGMTSFAPEVYRAHARELIKRALERTMSLDLATEAEVLMNMCSASLIAPPNQQWAALQERLFVKVMGRELEGDRMRDPWPHASDELLAELRRKCGVIGRGR